MAGHDIHLKRAYEPPAAADGTRILVDRIWPRGVRKEDGAPVLRPAGGVFLALFAWQAWRGARQAAPSGATVGVPAG